jgi:hypothetical protein
MTPDRIFDHTWAMTLLDRVCELTGGSEALGALSGGAARVEPNNHDGDTFEREPPSSWGPKPDRGKGSTPVGSLGFPPRTVAVARSSPTVERNPEIRK